MLERFQFQTSLFARREVRKGFKLFSSRWIAADTGNFLHILSAESGELFRTITETASIASVSFPPDSARALTSAVNSRAKLWQLDNGTKLWELDSGFYGVRKIQFLPNCKQLLSVSGDRKFRIWDSATGTLVNSFGEATSEVIDLQILPDEQAFLTLERLGSDNSSDARSLQLRGLGDGSPIGTGHTEIFGLTTLAASSGGEVIAFGRNDSSLFAFELSKLTINLDKQDVVITWPRGTLQTSDQISGNWTGVEGYSSLRVQTNGRLRFFRLKFRSLIFDRHYTLQRSSTLSTDG